MTMKGFSRNNLLLSLCGLNCGLCPMRLDGRCPGCGGGEGNQSCKLAKCSLEHRNVVYCCDCGSYPCEKYQHFDDFDSFITHRRRAADLMRMKEIGEDAYNAEQREKVEILQFLLAHFNDGRRKSFFCAAVNLLELSELREVTRRLREIHAMNDIPQKESSACAVKVLQEAAVRQNIVLKLRRKTKKTL